MYKKIMVYMLAMLVLFSACGKRGGTEAAPASETFTPDVTADELTTVADIGENQDEEIEAENLDVSEADLLIVATPEASPTPTPRVVQVEETTEEELPSAIITPVEPGTIGQTPNATTYEQYNNMSGDAQLAYMESFDSIESFVAWYNAALAEYEAASNPIEITDGVIDLGELIGE